jgi:hypothetical protein
MDSGSVRVGPRRFMTSTTIPPSAGRTPSRKVAGDESWAAASGRIRISRVSVAWAARCNRLKASDRMCCCQKSSAPQLRAFSTRSAHQSASDVHARCHERLRSRSGLVVVARSTGHATYLSQGGGTPCWRRRKSDTRRRRKVELNTRPCAAGIAARRASKTGLEPALDVVDIDIGGRRTLRADQFV